MCAPVSYFHSRAWQALTLLAWLCAACGESADSFVSVGDGNDAGTRDDGGASTAPEPSSACDVIELDGDFVIEREQDFTARFRVGESVTRTVMLFGGEPVDEINVLGNAYILGLDKADALQVAQEFPDFYLCSSAGGQAVADLILSYEFLPASCDVYEQIVDALHDFNRNARSGGDRTSLRFEAAPLELVSVIDRNGNDVTEQVGEDDYHLVTSVEQLTGQSVLDFGLNE